MANKPKSNNRSSAKAKPSASATLEKYLAFAFLISVVVSFLAILVILLAPVVSNTWVPVGWGMIPILVMPFGFVCLIALLMLSAINRKKANQNN